MEDTEKWTRFGVGLGHTIGGTVLTIFGAGAVVPLIGQAEDMALESAFPKQINPGPRMNEAIRQASAPASMPAAPKSTIDTGFRNR